MEFPKGFVLHGKKTVRSASSPTPAELGPLAQLVGTWAGGGFNTIWRPNFPPSSGSDNVLELNVTSETLVFDVVPGLVPNRGLVQGDINLACIRYLQTVTDANTGEGIHMEPGLWANVPQTTDPAEGSTVVRMASIPHGTTLLAQGTATTVQAAPVIPDVDITPFVINSQPPTRIPFPGEFNLSQASPFRIPSAAQPQQPPLHFPITQAMLNNPNQILTTALTGMQVASTTTLQISTLAGQSGLTTPVGGGTSNIAFLVGAGNGPNADAVQVDATFWIVSGVQATRQVTWLLYSQMVLLNFNGLSWPHVSVAALLKQ